MKLIIRKIGYLCTFLFPVSIYASLVKIFQHIYTGYKSRQLQFIGKNTALSCSSFFIGEQYISIGNNSFIGKRCVITAWGKRGSDQFDPNISIGDNVCIGDDCHITAINRIKIGNDVLLGKKITITDNSHGKIDLENLKIPPLQRELYSKGEIIIGDKVWIGDKATILPNVTIGEGAIIGANSVVTKDVPAYAVAVGNPSMLKNVRGGVISVIVIYFPDVDKVTSNIKQFINEIDKLVVWNNTPISERGKYKIEMPEYEDKIIYLSTDKNEGTAIAYNKAAEWGLANNYDYLLIMDQDSIWINFNQYKQVALNYLLANPNAIITPVINKRFTSSTIREIDTCISSGMLFPLTLYTYVGMFEEKLFVEGVDWDYCLRAKILNIKIIEMPWGCLQQQFGNTIYSKTFHCYTRGDSPARTYNIILNHILIIKKYHAIMRMHEIKMIIWNYIIARFFKIILLEEDKMRKCWAIIKSCYIGLVHYRY
jgi:acetyltransferase-like isoleucine patch superfamily enzyme/GT2 family glycosyltransferase